MFMCNGTHIFYAETHSRVFFDHWVKNRSANKQRYSDPHKVFLIFFPAKYPRYGGAKNTWSQNPFDLNVIYVYIDDRRELWAGDLYDDVYIIMYVCVCVCVLDTWVCVYIYVHM